METTQGIKSKAGAIKCYKEIKNTAPPNEWRNIPFLKKKLAEKCKILSPAMNDRTSTFMTMQQF